MIKKIYTILIMSVALLMAACSSDSETAGLTDDNGYVQLRIMTESSRAKVTRWQDTKAEDKEMMNLWVVVVTDGNGVVKKCYACAPTGTQREDDDVAQLPKGNYTVYSFANISVANVCSLLGITAPATIPTIGATPVAIDVTGTVSDDGSKTATINGNNFDPTATNNYGVAGIPMSNKQTITAQDVKKDLIVVRMMAKIVLKLYNETGSPVTVKEVTLSDITDNAANNLKLLPSLSNPDDMSAHDKDIQPNLNENPAPDKVDFIYEVPSNQQTVGTALYSNGIPAQTLTFYINESATPQNAEGLFYLTLKMSNTEYRYAIINDEDNHGWNYIARNDYRIIPIVIDDYKLELIPYDFPPIGVYPSSVSEIEQDLYEMTFHDYGHFHLVPRVTKGTSTAVGYNVGSGDYWTLQDTWASTLKTAVTKGGTWIDGGNPDLSSDVNTHDYFYEVQPNPATSDGGDNGGVPAFEQTMTWNGFSPYIFGKIAEPATLPLTDDRQIYHEFRVKLYVGGKYRRELLYRFYMTLSKDQLLYHTSTARRSHDL